MLEPNPSPEPVLPPFGKANELFNLAQKLVTSPEASSVGILRTIDGREAPTRVASLIDKESKAAFHVRVEEDKLNNSQTAHIAWFSLAKDAENYADGCIQVIRDQNGNAQMTAREYKRLLDEREEKFWWSRGPQSFIDRLHLGGHRDMTEERMLVVSERLSKSIIDKVRSKRESMIISVDNMTGRKGYRANVSTYALYKKLLYEGFPEETVLKLRGTDAFRMEKLLIEQIGSRLLHTPRKILQIIANQREGKPVFMPRYTQLEKDLAQFSKTYFT